MNSLVVFVMFVLVSPMLVSAAESPIAQCLTYKDDTVCESCCRHHGYSQGRAHVGQEDECYCDVYDGKHSEGRFKEKGELDADYELPIAQCLTYKDDTVCESCCMHYGYSLGRAHVGQEDECQCKMFNGKQSEGSFKAKVEPAADHELPIAQCLTYKDDTVCESCCMHYGYSQGRAHVGQDDECQCQMFNGKHSEGTFVAKVEPDVEHESPIAQCYTHKDDTVCESCCRHHGYSQGRAHVGQEDECYCDVYDGEHSEGPFEANLQ